MSGASSDSVIHASAVLLGPRALLVRGAPGSGKSALVLALLADTTNGFVRLVADDQVALEARAGRLLARPPAAIAGLVEVRQLGLVGKPHERLAQVALIVDLLDPAQVARLPEGADLTTELCGVSLPRLALGRHDRTAPAKAALAMQLVLSGARLPAF